MKLFDYLRSLLGILKNFKRKKSKESVSNPSFYISEALYQNPNAVLIFRIGGIETGAIYSFMKKGRITAKQRLNLQKNAGFYYNSDSELSEFVSLNIRALNDSDLYAYWDSLNQFKLVDMIGIDKEIITLRSLEPFWPEYSWLNTDNIINVTVVSPFIKTMKGQSKNLGLIHPNVRLENCRFKFVKSPLTNGLINKNILKISWLVRLNKMHDEVVFTNPDVVLIGAGAYGLPLGGLLKKSGVNAVVCGGSLQLLFGIKGGRWDERQEYHKIYNNYWVRPLEEEKPKGYESIEGGCYW